MELGSFPWVDSGVRLAVRHLGPDQVDEYIREVRRQYRADVRERAHTILEADLGAGGGRHRRRTLGPRRPRTQPNPCVMHCIHATGEGASAQTEGGS
jgi:hypothetical protein